MSAALMLLLGAAEPAVRAAEAAYDEGNFEVVLLKTDQALNRKLSTADRRRALELRAVALTAFNRRPEAVTAFEQLLELAPDYRPPDSLGPKVGAAFEEARAGRAEARATPDDQPKPGDAVAKDAPRVDEVIKVEVEVEDSRPPVIVRALPFGIGQFSRGAKDRGLIFLATELVAFSTSAITLAMFESLKTSPDDRFLSAGTFRAEDASRAYTLQAVYVAAFWTGVAAIAVGAAEGLLADDSPAPAADPLTLRRLPPRGLITF